MVIRIESALAVQSLEALLEALEALQDKKATPPFAGTGAAMPAVDYALVASALRLAQTRSMRQRMSALLGRQAAALTSSLAPSVAAALLPPAPLHAHLRQCYGAAVTVDVALVVHLLRQCCRAEKEKRHAALLETRTLLLAALRKCVKNVEDAARGAPHPPAAAPAPAPAPPTAPATVPPPAAAPAPPTVPAPAPPTVPAPAPPTVPAPPTAPSTVPAPPTATAPETGPAIKWEHDAVLEELQLLKKQLQQQQLQQQQLQQQRSASEGLSSIPSPSFSVASWPPQHHQQPIAWQFQPPVAAWQHLPPWYWQAQAPAPAARLAWPQGGADLLMPAAAPHAAAAPLVAVAENAAPPASSGEDLFAQILKTQAVQQQQLGKLQTMMQRTLESLTAPTADLCLPAAAPVATAAAAALAAAPAPLLVPAAIPAPAVPAAAIPAAAIPAAAIPVAAPNLPVVAAAPASVPPPAAASTAQTTAEAASAPQSEAPQQAPKITSSVQQQQQQQKALASPIPAQKPSYPFAAQYVPRHALVPSSHMQPLKSALKAPKPPSEMAIQGRAQPPSVLLSLLPAHPQPQPQQVSQSKEAMSPLDVAAVLLTL